LFKKVILIAVLMVSLVAFCSASPLMDYSAGKTAEISVLLPHY